MSVVYHKETDFATVIPRIKYKNPAPLKPFSGAGNGWFIIFHPGRPLLKRILFGLVLGVDARKADHGEQGEQQRDIGCQTRFACLRVAGGFGGSRNGKHTESVGRNHDAVRGADRHLLGVNALVGLLMVLCPDRIVIGADADVLFGVFFQGRKPCAFVSRRADFSGLVVWLQNAFVIPAIRFNGRYQRRTPRAGDELRVYHLSAHAGQADVLHQFKLHQMGLCRRMYRHSYFHALQRELACHAMHLGAGYDEQSTCLRRYFHGIVRGGRAVSRFQAGSVFRRRGMGRLLL